MPSDIARWDPVAKKRRGIYRVWCRPCRYAYKAAVVLGPAFKPNGANVYFSRLLREYGLREETYNTMLSEQNYLCKICRQPNKDGKRLCVDHDHSTGRVRGLLCHRCNGYVGRYDRLYRGDNVAAVADRLRQEAGEDETKLRLVTYMDESYASRHVRRVVAPKDPKSWREWL